eukprot:3017349-Rhodomonas_salina.2
MMSMVLASCNTLGENGEGTSIGFATVNEKVYGSHASRSMPSETLSTMVLVAGSQCAEDVFAMRAHKRHHAGRKTHDQRVVEVDNNLGLLEEGERDADGEGDSDGVVAARVGVALRDIGHCEERVAGLSCRAWSAEHLKRHRRHVAGIERHGDHVLLHEADVGDVQHDVWRILLAALVQQVELQSVVLTSRGVHRRAELHDTSGAVPACVDLGTGPSLVGHGQSDLVSRGLRLDQARDRDAWVEEVLQERHVGLEGDGERVVEARPRRRVLHLRDFDHRLVRQQRCCVAGHSLVGVRHSDSVMVHEAAGDADTAVAASHQVPCADAHRLRFLYAQRILEHKGERVVAPSRHLGDHEERQCANLVIPQPLSCRASRGCSKEVLIHCGGLSARVRGSIEERDRPGRRSRCAVDVVEHRDGDDGSRDEVDVGHERDAEGVHVAGVWRALADVLDDESGAVHLERLSIAVCRVEDSSVGAAHVHRSAVVDPGGVVVIGAVSKRRVVLVHRGRRDGDTTCRDLDAGRGLRFSRIANSEREHCRFVSLNAQRTLDVHLHCVGVVEPGG